MVAAEKETLSRQEQEGAADSQAEERAAESRAEKRAAGAQAEEEVVRRLQAEISRLPVAEHLLLMLQSLSALALDRLGFGKAAKHRDFEQARLAIDAFKALLGVLERVRSSEEIAVHRGVLAQLQMTYVETLERGSAGEEAPASAEGRSEGAA